MEPMIVDIRCEGDEFRVSLRAMNRHEYEEALVRIDAVADMIWPSGRAAPDLSRDPVEPPQDGEKLRQQFLERQGL